MVDTPQKAAIEAFDKYKKTASRPTSYQDLQWEAFQAAWNTRATLRDNQGCAVVTVEELLEITMNEALWSREDFIKWQAKKYPSGLVIAPEKKETP